MMRNVVALALGLAAHVAAFAPSLAAQQVAPALRVHPPAAMEVRAPEPQGSIRPDSPGALALEAIGGTAGSLVGIGAVLLTSDCNVDDLGCEILSIIGAGAAGVVGSTVATQLVAGHTGSRRSVLGAALGGAVGTGVGLGLHYLINANSDTDLDSDAVIPLFAVSQGVFAALGSRLIGAARGMR